MKTLKQWVAAIKGLGVAKNSFDQVDESSEESFPASDSPAWTSARHKDSTLSPSEKLEDPIKILTLEHQVIMQMIYTIHEQIEQLQRNNPLETENLIQIIEFMRAFVDKGHHQKEENYLFPALESSGAPLADCRLDSFKQDHALGQTLVENLEKYLADYEKNDPQTHEKLINILTQLKDIYTRHTLKEENMVFPLAEKYLSKGAQKTLVAQFEKIDAQMGV